MNFWKQVLLNLRLIKVRRFLGSFFYPLQRDALERRFQSSPNIEVFAEIGDILRAETTQRGGKFYFQNVELEICLLAEDLVRIDWQPGVLPIPYASARKDWPEIAVKFQELGDRWLISTASLKVIISLNGSVELQNALGQTIREELPPQQKTSGWLHQAKLRSLEHIYGLGERAAPLNLRTTPATSSYQMWNYDAGGRYGPGTDPLYLCIPAYLGLHDLGSYLIFYENSYKATFSFNGYAAADFTGGALRYYLSLGTPAQLLDRYTELTGRPALPPRWVLGYHQSRWGYETETAVREVAEGFITHDLPLSAIHLDIDCQDGFRAFTINPDNFPKLADFNHDLVARGVHLIAIVNPGVKADRKSELFEEGRAQEVFCQLPNGKLVIAPVWPGLCAFPDFTNPQARHWWSRQYEYLLDLGFTGFWHDMNEPGVFVLWGDPSLPQHSTQHFLEGRGGDHREAHNVYGLLQAEAAYEALSEYKPELRPFIVSRAGWAGLQRYAWTWTGDIETSWSGLRQTIPTVLNLGLSGIPYSGADIGGFKGNPSAELYLRWFQMSTFLPFFRTHSANNVKPRTPWGFGEPTLSIVREFLQLRYRLMPYLYTLAWEANQKGYPLMRPLFWADSTDQDLWDVEDAFLLGDAILVAAIVESGATSRSITLPKGYWYNFWDDTLLEGAKTVNIAAPIEQIPLLVKAGSILPMSVEKQLILHIYAPMSLTSEGRVYSDAGDGYGEWRLDEFYLKRDGDILEITWQKQGNYTFPYNAVKLHFHGVEVQQAWVDTQKVNFPNNCLEVEQFQRVRLEGKMA
ncbi:glycoside hydrolase family 31 protein [Nodularia spumigena]|uniref:glycoside hydrolase family 31 protein n=1 Tax=Nodularia spumigena TaxID=70799 RepID=UPI00232DE635|nr:glycoside hydrolase family 31 protein [Nodularia spumigena]MDB9318542.1 glycoside hydrolase family 31 protein [Nodularia spumigena CS-590/01A]MDB9320588.1 glycoside hydrolase family 31 protein [Nodularia spumigena CS-591/07A]MDB9325466.1 glycoside hydrolase family 31 protein [Nodularia spumigena CS-590/02]MDB9332413.1 glycoside hydrolase family 31 protein [Nodularia spumigena CS-591/04]MDB9336846.1 glycoside hydrolase family 31 protein [Nodularia spumigena CS-590/01]